ncbi:CocE/NonD family hydrolase [Citreimonas sp.]|uniref:CocE/NonD family hydrolase n=1 Tax=Citreimonas sp. TaxID=3036715 RepID=UPI00405A09E1
MKEVSSFPHAVEITEHVWIDLPNGRRLAARLWMPEDAGDAPVPAILEYLPYRKRDLTRGRDAINHPYLAGHGYACVRVDMLGSGESDGVLVDEYTEDELADGVAVIEWIASQKWCDGNVGMFGISWGGFNGLQIAARQPEALKAIVSCCASDDLYEDNMHYMGGCLLGDQLSEATVMAAFNSQPPDPAIVGDRWRDMWLDRLDGSGLWIKKWLEHQRRDTYWSAHSVCEDYSAIQCPVLAAGGWTDGYTNAIFRLVENLEVPSRALIGPWGHKYAHMGVPGPSTGFLQEVLRWFDHWLKGIDTGADEFSEVRVWMQDPVPPSASHQDRPGRWVREPHWPSDGITPLEYRLGHRRLFLHEDNRHAFESGFEETLVSPLSVGLYAGKWCSYAALPDLPHDQREEDGGCLVYDTETLEEDIEMLGRPEVELEIAADKPIAQVAVRLSDILPDGRATRVTYGVLNLTHRDGHADPQPLEPGRFYRVRVPLNGLATRLPAGHKLRLSISSTYFPLIWAPPEAVQLTLRPEGCSLRLPERRRRNDPPLRELGEPEGAPALPVEPLRPPEASWQVVRDMVRDEAALVVLNDEGSYRIPEIDMTVRRRTEERYSFRDAQYDSLRGETRTERGFSRGDWSAHATTHTVLTCDAENFYVHATLDAYEGARRIFSRNWDETIPRDML